MLAASPIPLFLSRDRISGTTRPDAAPSLYRVRRGAYVSKPAWTALPPWERYLVRVHAVARLWRNPVFCLESAAALHGLPIFGEPRYIHLLSENGRSWREGDVVVHGALDERAVRTVEGTSLTSGLDTATDLARVLPPAFALAVSDALQRMLLPHARRADLHVHGQSQANRRGLRQLAWVQQRTTAAAESPGESVSRAAIEWLGYADPELQVTLRAEGFADRIDFAFRCRGRTIGGESDGYGKYDAADPTEMKKRLIHEKTREDRIRRQLDGFTRWDWSDAVTAAPLDHKLRVAGVEPVRSANHAMLETLRVNPRSFPGGRR